jgi:aconitate hydratase
MRSELADVRQEIDTPQGKARIFNPLKLKERGYDVERLPYSLKVLLENALRHSGKVAGAEEAAMSLATWPKSAGSELPLLPFRVLLQDYTGVPLVVDLAAMRDAAAAAGLSPGIVNSSVPVDLIIDHSIQVDAWSSEIAFDTNLRREYERNSERYSLLKWAQSAFTGMRVFPPGKGICHQVNLEYLSRVVATSNDGGEFQAFPDSVLGTDSHTTMVNGLGVLGWGVGGIEAEAVILGEPYHMPIPEVLGVKLTGSLQEGVTPTDMVLAVTEKLREKNVVGKFVEYFGKGYGQLTVPDRATLGNMAPEYGATVGFCPVDEGTLSYLAGTGREASHIEFVRRYAKETGLFLSDIQPKYSEILVIDLDRIEPSVAGPRNPEERRPLKSVPAFARTLFADHQSAHTSHGATGSVPGGSGGQLVLQKSNTRAEGLEDGAVVIAAITSCTNTSNPTVMVGAGLLAKNAVEAGLEPMPWVKRSLAPGSMVVTDYLDNSGLLPYLDRLGFNVVGYGCTTCIGNSGPLAPEIEQAIKARDLYAVAVLSGNRNFDGRISPLAKGSFLMSPMLVVAYSLAGRIDFDFQSTPLGIGKKGERVYLKDIWPTMKEIKEVVEKSLSPGLYRKRYAEAMKGDSRWEGLAANADERYHWESGSTYVRQPPWFEVGQSTSKKDILGARALTVLEDKVTTDHISPAGAIPLDSPAGKYLTSHGVEMVRFSSYGSRRGNHEVMVRGGFANIRLRNALSPNKEGGWTMHLPSGETMPVFDAATRYAATNTPLVVVAGKQYGAGSSRDWAAKAPKLLGVRAVIAESFERIHRSNLVTMGVLPLQFLQGQSRASLGLRGEETFDITGVSSMTEPKKILDVVARSSSGEKRFRVLCRIDNSTEMQYIERGGVLPFVFSKVHSSVH